MPIYEYRCEDCRAVRSILVRSSRTTVEPRCEACGSTAMHRLVSRVARVRSARDVIGDRGIPKPGEPIDDPRQIGAWVERRFDQYGIPVPEETRRMIDAARDGDLPGPVADL